MNPEESAQEEDNDDFQSIAPVDNAKTGSASYQVNHYLRHILIIFKLGRSWTPPGAQEHVQEDILPRGAVHAAKVVFLFHIWKKGVDLHYF